jgi:tetratricopeptide (TPR) repeat protein
MKKIMTNFEVKVYLMVAFVFSLAANVLAQETSTRESSFLSVQPITPTPQPRSSNVQRPASDVVEVETEIGVAQMKPSDRIEKPTIKPRADYGSDPKLSVPDDLEPTSSVQRPDASVQLPTSSVQSSASNVQPPTASVQSPVETITDAQVVELSSSLRKLIEDNNQLKAQIADLNGQLKTVRGQQKLESNRFNEVALERDALKKQNENIVSQGSQTQKQLETLQQQLTQKEQDYSMQIVRLQTELAQKLQTAPVDQPATINDQPLTSTVQQPASSVQRPSVSVNLVSAPTSEEARERGQKVLLALNSVSEEKQKLSRDEAKVHYNMGNTYFNQGDYVQAAKEYVRALELSPEDASAHYNLAFVSGEFLNDPKVALDHYKKYLYFNPHAQDAQMVEQKIIESQIAVKGDVHFKSQINEELRNKKNDTSTWD